MHMIVCIKQIYKQLQNDLIGQEDESNDSGDRHNDMSDFIGTASSPIEVEEVLPEVACMGLVPFSEKC